MSLNANSELNCNENFNVVALTESSYTDKVVNINKFIFKNICT